MLRTGGGLICDHKRYEETFKKALRDVEPILTDATRTHRASPPSSLSTTETGYRDFINVNEDVPTMLFGAEQTKKLIRKMAEKLGYKVRFLPLGNGAMVGVTGFVSWLWVYQKTKILHVVYDSQKVKEFTKISDSDNPEESRHRLWADQLLAKIYLHEYGHASLHLADFLHLIGQGKFPQLGPQHEQDAWLYAETIWGILIGDHAHWSRTLGQTADESWKFA